MTDWRESVWCRLARVAAMSSPIQVDPRAASAALRKRTHDAYLRALQVVRGHPSRLEGQRDETISSALRAWPHDSHGGTPKLGSPLYATVRRNVGAGWFRGCHCELCRGNNAARVLEYKHRIHPEMRYRER